MVHSSYLFHAPEHMHGLRAACPRELLLDVSLLEKCRELSWSWDSRKVKRQNKGSMQKGRMCEWRDSEGQSSVYIQV